MVLNTFFLLVNNIKGVNRVVIRQVKEKIAKSFLNILTNAQNRIFVVPSTDTRLVYVHKHPYLSHPETLIWLRIDSG